MKIFIDWLKKAITKIEHDSELYVGNQFSNKFDVYFYNVGTDTDWFPTLTQLAPNGREAGPFSADSDSFTTTTIDSVTYVVATFTMGTGYAFMKGVSSFFLYENRITTPHPTKSVIGKFIVTLNNSDNGYFIDDPEFNPKVKEYVDKYSQLRFGGEASTSVIEALDSNQGVWLATDTGYYWYWDYDNNEYVRGNLFQAVSVADNGISTAKIANGAVTENKLALQVQFKINNSVQNGENNPTAASNVHTNIVNSNSEEEDTDESYGSQIDLSLDKAIVGHAYSSNGTTKHSKIEFDEYHDNTTNEDYPRAVIETELWDTATPENSKITILKDLIELLSGGKIKLISKTGIDITSGDDTNEIEGNINIESKYGDINIETDTDHEITIISGGGINLRDDTYIVNSNLHVDREIYENNKRVATKEYVEQQIDIIEASGLQTSDIANNLTTDDSTKVLSAAQGVVLKGFIDSINTLLQCDDTTLDEIQEIVDYIKNNKSLIDGITTSKVSVSDIINNLTSNATNKPLSAAQGKALKDTLDSVQASISALTTNKQDKIDSSHKLDADLVSDTTSSNKFVSAYLKSLITTNRQDINLLDGRVTNLENNPTSNVSGTNDGTNWTSITIGNDTYAIPSGSSSGGSGSGETLKIFEFTDVFPAPLRIGINSTKLNEFFTAVSQGMGITIDESNLSLIWANASDYEKLTALLYLSMYSLFSNYDGFMVSTYRPTTVEVDGQTVVTLIYLLVITTNEQIATFNNKPDISSSTFTITTIGGGNGGSSASSGAYYEIKTNDIAFYDENGTQITSDLENLIIKISEGQFEALKNYAIPVLTAFGITVSINTINDLVALMNETFVETSTSNSNNSEMFFNIMAPYCDFSYIDNFTNLAQHNLYYDIDHTQFLLINSNTNGGNGVFQALLNNGVKIGISATWTLTEYGTSGGSSTSESYYKIKLQDSGTSSPVVLQMLIPHDSMSEILANISDIMQQTITTPTDLINLFDTLKGNANYYNHLLILMVYFAIINQQFSLNNLYEENNDGATGKISAVWLLGGIFVNGTDIFSTELGPSTISFTSNASLTITETTTQEIEPTIDYIDLWTHILGGN